VNQLPEPLVPEPSVPKFAAEEAPPQPFYARLLRLRHLEPGALLCFCFFEGAIGLAALLALAEVVPWWAVVALPAAIAVMVKVNDLVAGAVLRSAAGVAEREQQRLRQLVTPAVGRAPVRRARGYARCGAAARPNPSQWDTQVLPRVKG
jgi:hypothetical protein